MFKRILLYVLSGIVGANFGVLSAVFPLFYFPLAALTDARTVDSSPAPLILSALLCGAIAGMLYYVYRRRQRLNHEEMPVYLTSTVVGYLIGIAMVIIVSYLISADSYIPYT